MNEPIITQMKLDELRTLSVFMAKSNKDYPIAIWPARMPTLLDIIAKQREALTQIEWLVERWGEQAVTEIKHRAHDTLALVKE